jgi:hypothetical protein
MTGQDMICAHIRSFPMLEVVHAAEGGATARTKLLESLCKGDSTLQLVTVSSGGSGSVLRWTADSG